MSRLLRIAVPCVAIAVVAVTTGMGLLTRWGGSRSVPVAEVVRGDFVHRVVAEGVLEAEQATQLTPPRLEGIGEMKIAWIAEDGIQVEEGEVVVRFDATEMEKELFDGESERAKALSRRDQKEVEESTALENLGRDAELADVQLEYARAFQPKDEEIFSRVEIIESEIDETLAIQRKSHATGIQEIREDLSAVELELLDLEKRKAEITIERAESGLRELELRAPHAGILVLSRNNGEVPQVGTMVYWRQPVAEIPQLDAMKAVVYVLEADAGGVRPGIPAEVMLEAHPGEPFPGSVRHVAAVAKRRSRYSPVQYFDVEVALERTDPERMKPGQRVRATLLLQDLEDVLTVPREAVFEGENGTKVVYRRSGSGFEPVEVKLGAAALGRVVVEAGLSGGDVIALVDPRRGEAVRNAGAETNAVAPQPPGRIP
jgi:RND family efflux transporter MFP subunit